MSASFPSPTFSSQARPPEEAPPTADLDPTTDFHEENTSDLPTTTVDVAPTGAPDGAAPADAPDDVARAAAPDDVAPMSAPDDRAPVAPTDASPTPSLACGMVLNDRYLLEEMIGSGGVAIVYRARDLQSTARTKVAVKAPRPELHDHSRARRRITHEHEHARALSHPNIVRVFDLYADAGVCFMTMELLEGKLLSQLMGEGAAPAPEAHRILQGCARALTHAHGRNIVHGDFKPGNVFITAAGDVKVIDFGSAAAPRSADSRIAAGTPTYASPEVLGGQTPHVRDDVFSFACVAYELLTGQHPFERRSSVQARDEGFLPPRAWSLSAAQWLALLAALSWNREQRPASVESLANALAPEPTKDDAIGARTPDKRRTGGAGRDTREEWTPPQRSWGFFVFIACALAVTFLASRRQSEREPPRSAAPIVAPTPRSAASMLAATPADAEFAGTALGRRAPDSSSMASSSIRASGSAVRGVAPTKEPAAPAPAKPRPAAARSDISFESAAIVTSEASVAVVFLLRRSEPLSGRASAQWRLVGGTADESDFASQPSGVVEFADGQGQRAVYLPLRNDALREGNETFTVRLQSPRNAGLGEISSLQATIRDDD